MSDDIEHPEEASGDEGYFDPIAERTRAYCGLLSIAGTLKEDEELRKEAILMLKSLRSSFKTFSTAELRSLDGGKP